MMRIFKKTDHSTFWPSRSQKLQKKKYINGVRISPPPLVFHFLRKNCPAGPKNSGK